MKVEDTPFLPQGYSTASNGYMKLKEGDNKIRVLSSAIVGYENWHDKKPHRWRINGKPPADIQFEDKNKLFWAFIVFNYEQGAVQILEITQAQIRKQLESLVNDKDWGNPKEYDISIKRSGTGMDTSYSVLPKSHSKLTKEIQEAVDGAEINLEALFDGGDPFNSNDGGEDNGNPF